MFRFFFIGITYANFTRIGGHTQDVETPLRSYD